jgi:ABC-type amino acid transport substrate-binding protein
MGGKLILLLFILFAAWFAGHEFSIQAYPKFVFLGLFSFFGSTNMAMPFMLDTFQLPADLFQLYVLTTVITSRFCTMLASMDLLVLALMATCAMTGLISVSKKRLVNFLLVSALVMAGAIGGARVSLTLLIDDTYTKDKEFRAMSPLRKPVAVKVHKQPLPAPPPRVSGESRLEEIAERGFVRVGYYKDVMPFAFTNDAGQFVGFDVEMAHLLAKELGVKLELVLIDPSNLADQLKSGFCDVVAAVVTPEMMQDVAFSAPFMDETLAFIVPDHRRDEFSRYEAVQSLDALKIAIPDIPYYVSKMKALFPRAEVMPVETSPREFLWGELKDVDAFVHSAESGSAWTLLHPQYSVVVPQPLSVSIPVAFAMAPGDSRMVAFMDSWVELKKRDGTIDDLFNYWIFGKGADKKEPRWSVIRNVLHWVD